MKKWGFLILALLLGNTLLAQFELTEYNGFTDINKPQNNYIVVEFPGKTQKELYNACIADLRIKRHTSEFEFDGVRNEAVTICHFIPRAVYGTYKGTFGIKSEFFRDIDFTVSLRFKDGKIRADSPFIKALLSRTKTTVNGQEAEQLYYYWINYEDCIQSGLGGTPIYNRKHVLKEPELKKALEDFINAYVYGIMDGIHAQISPEDW